MFVFLILSILITLLAAAATVRAMITDRAGARGLVGEYDSRRPSL
jgi:hypothetical protein